ncbi:unnamed protein product [Rotaria sordida]|uniref:Uncharacterized protein n=1 Tax=Rotaria sordida TaxID=392033 RepID=A0A815VZJ8_9BILA|nr:unnamed protein product [Rotaria sordida]CAF1667201.1 unnamed protein product [Rotaria sordida]
MMNFDNLFRHFILTQSFVRGWANSFRLQEIFIYRREKIGVRDECLEIVPTENVQQNTVEIIKQEIKSNQNYTNARFRSPLANYLLHLVSPQVATAHFQLVLPCDHRFGIDSIPIGIYSILLENSYYGLRKPPDQSRSSLLYVTDLYIMAILHGFSLGGHMASLAFTKWPDLPCRQFYKNKASQTFYDYLRERRN